MFANVALFPFTVEAVVECPDSYIMTVKGCLFIYILLYIIYILCG